MKNTRFNIHFLLVGLLSVMAFQAYGMDTVTDTQERNLSEADRTRALDFLTAGYNKLKEMVQNVTDRVTGVETRQEETVREVKTLEGKVQKIEGRVENLENKVVPVATQPAEQSTVPTIVEKGKEVGTAVVKKVVEAKDTVVETGKNLAGAAQKKAGEIGQGAQKLTNEIKKEGKTAIAYLHEKAKAAYDAITNAPQDTYTWTKKNPGKALAVAVAIGITIYVGYELYKASKKAAKKRIVRRIIASNIVA